MASVSEAQKAADGRTVPLFPSWGESNGNRSPISRQTSLSPSTFRQRLDRWEGLVSSGSDQAGSTKTKVNEGSFQQTV